MDLNEVREISPASAASLDGWRRGDGWLAGGTWLFSEPQPGLERLLDLTAMGWPGLLESADGLEIAATCTLAELAAWPGRPEWPASRLPRQCCEALLASFKVWNTATVGGNICLALPAGSIISLAAALDGICTIWGPGGVVCEMPVLGFVLGAGATALAPGELLRSIRLPSCALACTTAFRQFSLTPVGRSAALVIGRRSTSGEVVITVSASVLRPEQLRFGEPPSAATLQAELDARELVYYDDVHGDPRWRAQITRVLAEEVRVELDGGGA
ncbi:MAG: FAD binding domain-containing protein [Solirubrobacteraceae bacterium]